MYLTQCTRTVLFIICFTSLSFFSTAPAAETEEKKKTKKKVKKTEPKDLSMFDADAPNIFDDPLSALGTS